MYIKYFSPEDQALAQEWSNKTKIEICDSSKKSEEELFYIAVKNGEVFIAESDSDKAAIMIDFNRPDLEKKLRENSPSVHPLKKALGKPINGLVVLDGTAGFLEDSFLIASWGAEVQACERNKLMFALIEDALSKVAKTNIIYSLKTDYLNYFNTDFLTHLKKNKDSINVLYLDPMYPEKKKKALSAKKHRVIKELVGSDEDFEDMFRKCLDSFDGRIVLKRPLKAPILLEEFRVASFSGRSTRYDLYLNK